MNALKILDLNFIKLQFIIIVCDVFV